MRRGVSLLEVMFAVIVVAVGLLGSISVLTVASTVAKRGRVNDSVASLGPMAVHDFDARGWRSTSQWVKWNTTTNAWGQYTPGFGESVCIDPRFIAANASTPVPSSIFPYVPTTAATQVRMSRLTLNNGLGLPMSKVLSDDLFTFAEDLTVLRDDTDKTLAPSQAYTTLPAAPASLAKRETDGQYSWMATVSPRIDRYSLSFNNEYVLSVVIFHQRVGFDMSVGTEQVYGVSFPGAGVTGGEVLLTGPTEPNIRSGDWIMLAGRSTQHVLNPATGQLSLPVPVFGWYRVLDTEAESTPVAGGFERYATLMGRDFSPDTTDHQAFVIAGVAAVYEKTIKLE